MPRLSGHDDDHHVARRQQAKSWELRAEARALLEELAA
jgi:hypothetical protein